MDRLVNFDFTSLNRKIGQALVNKTVHASSGATVRGARNGSHGFAPRGGEKEEDRKDSGGYRAPAELYPRRALADWVESGTDVKYARIQKFGGRAGRGRA